MVDAPVSGGVARAAEGDLLIMVSGAEPAIERVRPLLDTLARNAPVVGEEPGDGQKVKLVNQLLCGVHIAAAAEALAFAEALGLDARASGRSCATAPRPRSCSTTAARACSTRPSRSPRARSTSSSRTWAWSGRPPARAASPSPLAAVAEQLYRAGSRAGLGRLDDSSLITLLRDDALP